MANTRAERWWFTGLSLLVFFHVLVRAATVPLVHDEATSFIAYAQTGHFLPFASMWDANNHYLNSLLGFFGYKLFGLHLIALRWGSVLSYVLFAWCAWQMGAYVQHRMVRWCMWLALLTCPFLLDFFSLFRGYGPAMAFLLLALHGTVRFMQEGQRQHLLAALGGALVANGFLLALLPLWAVLLALLSVRCWPDCGRRLIWSVFGLVPLLGAAGLAILMSHFGLLYHGSTGGFVEVTVASLVRFVLGTDGFVVSIIIVIMLVLATLAILGRTLHTRSWNSPGFIITLLLWSESIGRVIMANVFEVNYAEDRTALHNLLLSLLVLAFALDHLAARQRMALVLCSLLCFLPIRALLTANKTHTLLWPEQSVPDRFVFRVQELEQELGRPVVLGAHRHVGLPWSLQSRMLGVEGDVNSHGWPLGLHDARIVADRFGDVDMAGYVVVDSVPSSVLRLFIREQPLTTLVVTDTGFVLTTDTATTNIVFSGPVPKLRDGDVFVEIGGAIESEHGPVDLRLCTVVFDTLGRAVDGELIFLSTRRAHWEGETFHTTRLVRGRRDAGRVEVSLWNPHRSRVLIREGFVRAYAVEQ